MTEETGFENELLGGDVESGDRMYTFCEGNEAVESAADGLSHLWNQEGCAPASEEDLRAYFEEANNLQETFGDFDTYIEYMNKREDLIEAGEYDPGSWGSTVDTGGLKYQDPWGFEISADDYNNLSPNDFMAKYNIDKSEVEVIQVDTTKARQDGYNEWLSSEAVQELNAEYGISDKLQTEDGREYQWNGTGWVKVTEPDNMDFGRILKIATAITGAAVTGSALGPIIGGAIGGAAGTTAGAGVVSGAISSALGQVALTGGIDPSRLIQAALLGGLDAVAGAAIAGELKGTALDNALWDISGTLNISYEEAANILAGMASGAITGDDLGDIVLGAVGGWTESQVKDFLRGAYGDTVNVDDWFKDGQSHIPIEALDPFVEQIVSGIVDGTIDDPGAWLKTVYDYFSAGGDVDFMLPDGISLGDLFDKADFDFSLCGEDGGAWYCNIKVPGWDIPNPCGEGQIWDIDLGECIPDINIPNPCGEGEIWDMDLRECVPDIPNPCGEGEIWDIDLGECIPDLPDVVECMEGFEWDALLEECIKIPDVVECMEGWEWDDLLQECIKIDLPDVVECMEGWEWDDILEECVKLPDVVECMEGWEWDDLINECVKIEIPDGVECMDGWEWDDLLKECVQIDITIDKPKCLEGEEWDEILEKCVKLPDVVECMRGWQWDDLLGECVEIPDVVECMKGWEWDDLLEECVEIEGPDVDVDVDGPDIDIPTPPPLGGPEGGTAIAEWSPLFEYTTITAPEQSKYAPQLQALSQARGMMDDIFRNS